MGWNPSGWIQKTMYQIPDYNNLDKLVEIKNKLKLSNSIVSNDEIQILKLQLKQIEIGEGFFIQGGDCAESFKDFSEKNIISTYNLLNEMAKKINKNVTLIGRTAGQFAKPRSNEFDDMNGNKILSYRGDMINSSEKNKEARIPNPERMITAYKQSVKTSNILRKVCNNNFYISHDALMLHYEESLVRKNENDKYILTSTHLPWIGARTCYIDSSQVEFLSGVDNPIAIKVENNKSPDELSSVIKKLNPNNESGKIILIFRVGVGNNKKYLPKIISMVKNNFLNITWACDPMHANTKTLKNLKVRYLNDIIQEFKEFCEVCKAMNVYIGGVHLELTSDDVVECLNNKEEHFSGDYKTLCDPRLNTIQALKFIEEIAKLI